MRYPQPNKFANSASSTSIPSIIGSFNVRHQKYVHYDENFFQHD